MVPTGFAGVPARPFIEVRLHVQGSTPTAIPFLIDTGADRSVLHPADASQLGMAPWEIDFSSGPPISGVGGSMRIMPITTRVIFRTETDQYPRYVWMIRTIYLAEPIAERELLVVAIPARATNCSMRVDEVRHAGMEPCSAPERVSWSTRPDEDVMQRLIAHPSAGGRRA